jgi:hypothetical protein
MGLVLQCTVHMLMCANVTCGRCNLQRQTVQLGSAHDRHHKFSHCFDFLSRVHVVKARSRCHLAHLLGSCNSAMADMSTVAVLGLWIATDSKMWHLFWLAHTGCTALEYS